MINKKHPKYQGIVTQKGSSYNLCGEEKDPSAGRFLA
jgi:hypothetical protein